MYQHQTIPRNRPSQEYPRLPIVHGTNSSKLSVPLQAKRRRRRKQEKTSSVTGSTKRRRRKKQTNAQTTKKTKTKNSKSVSQLISRFRNSPPQSRQEREERKSSKQNTSESILVPIVPTLQTIQTIVTPVLNHTIATVDIISDSVEIASTTLISNTALTTTTSLPIQTLQETKLNHISNISTSNTIEELKGSNDTPESTETNESPESKETNESPESNELPSESNESKDSNETKEFTTSTIPTVQKRKHEKTYYIATLSNTSESSENKVGPLTLEQVVERIAHGHSNATTPTWFHGLNEWVPLGRLIEFRELLFTINMKTPPEIGNMVHMNTQEQDLDRFADILVSDVIASALNHIQTDNVSEEDIPELFTMNVETQTIESRIQENNERFVQKQQENKEQENKEQENKEQQGCTLTIQLKHGVCVNVVRDNTGKVHVDEKQENDMNQTVSENKTDEGIRQEETEIQETEIQETAIPNVSPPPPPFVQPPLLPVPQPQQQISLSLPTTTSISPPLIPPPSPLKILMEKWYTEDRQSNIELSMKLDDVRNDLERLEHGLTELFVSNRTKKTNQEEDDIVGDGEKMKEEISYKSNNFQFQGMPPTRNPLIVGLISEVEENMRLLRLRKSREE